MADWKNYNCWRKEEIWNIYRRICGFFGILFSFCQKRAWTMRYFYRQSCQPL